jgi:hypothetical protein
MAEQVTGDEAVEQATGSRTRVSPPDLDELDGVAREAFGDDALDALSVDERGWLLKGIELGYRAATNGASA